MFSSLLVSSRPSTNQNEAWAYPPHSCWTSCVLCAVHYCTVCTVGQMHTTVTLNRGYLQNNSAHSATARRTIPALVSIRLTLHSTQSATHSSRYLECQARQHDSHGEYQVSTFESAGLTGSEHLGRETHDCENNTRTHSGVEQYYVQYPVHLSHSIVCIA